MYTENGLLVDISEITDIVRHADVVTVSFRLFPERLLIDTRHDERDASGDCSMPMVAIVDPVASMQERFFWLGQHRPALGMPKNFMFFHWPHSVRYLDESGVWERVRNRVTSTHFAGARETCDDALRDLLAREHTATVEAIKGAHYQTLWSAREA
jgi:hypothetical protein